ncbi:MAG: hypothetical protein ABR915_02700 [Thermoguttaceae bacterium]|jgi:hypothetical protein
MRQNRAVTKRISGLVACLLAAGMVRAAEPAVAPSIPDLEIELRLFSTPEVARQKQEGLVLITDLARTDGRWERAWSILDVNNRKPGTSETRVAAAEVGQSTVNLTLELRRGDRYEIVLRKTPAGRFEGIYTGTRSGQSTRGGADARIKPARPAAPAGFAAVKPGEHPRILFRKPELPALREKFKTPFGQALAQHWTGPVGLGLKYQMTGDAKFAEQCARSVREQMADRGGGFPGGRAWGNRIEFIAEAYDLCCDAWTPDFKREVERYLLTEGGHWAGGGGSNAHVCSNRAAPQYGGAAIAGLALWGEPGPASAEPADEPGKRFWRDEVENCKRLGGADPRYLVVFERARQLMILHYREGIGAGGFHGECAHYATEATDNPSRYAAAFRRCFGYDVSPDSDITHWVPCRMMAHLYPPDGKPWVPLGINGWQTIPTGYFASLYPIVPEQMRPAVLWAWQRHGGFAGPDDFVKRLPERKGRDGKPDVQAFGLDPVWSFVTYPLDGKPRPPSVCMPLTWQADGLGFYAFRSGWEGKSDSILQVFAKSHPIGGWSGGNAGAFRLVALGVPWNCNAQKREIDRWEENCVMLAQDETNEGGCGRLTHAEFGKDGSGSLTMDLADVYAAKGGYTKYGNCRNSAAFANSSIAGLRAMAVDYSGACGAPCLFVLVDVIHGGKSKLWTWSLNDKSELSSVAIRGNVWTQTKGGASLQATFVTPAKPALAARLHTIDKLDFKNRPLHKEFPLVLADGGDAYFVVVTVQPAGSKRPEVKVDGAGLDAQVSVGHRAIRFDGTKIRIGEAP